MPRCAAPAAVVLVALAAQTSRVSGFVGTGLGGRAAVLCPLADVNFCATARPAAAIARTRAVGLTARLSAGAPAQNGTPQCSMSVGVRLCTSAWKHARALVNRLIIVASALALAVFLVAPRPVGASARGAIPSSVAAEVSREARVTLVAQEASASERKGLSQGRTMKQQAMLALSTASATGLVMHAFLAWRDLKRTSMRRGR